MKRLASIFLALCLVFVMLPARASAASFTIYDVQRGWYNIRLGQFHTGYGYLSINAEGNAEISATRDAKFYLNPIQGYMDNRVVITLQMENMLYLGIEGDEENGAQLTLVNEPYYWLLDIADAMRPRDNDKLVVNASGQSFADGTPVILWEHHYTPDHAVMQFLDWERPITKLEMAYHIYMVRAMYEAIRYTEDFITYQHFGEGDYLLDAAQHYLLEYGALPAKTSWNDKATYGEFVSTLMKYIDALEKNHRFKPKVTKELIKSFSIGDTSDSAKMTWEQAAVLTANFAYWYEQESYRVWNEQVPDHVPKPVPAFPPTLVASNWTSPAELAGKMAHPTNATFMLNGTEIAMPAYNIGGNNFVRLRDLAYVLKTRYDVRWVNGYVRLLNFVPYTPVGGELSSVGSESKPATPSNNMFIYFDKFGAWTGDVSLDAYNIGGNNFVKLRDIAELLGFDVDWRDGKVWIEPDEIYTED